MINDVIYNWSMINKLTSKILGPLFSIIGEKKEEEKYTCSSTLAKLDMKKNGQLSEGF